MLDRRPRNHRITLGADKAYDVMEFVGDLRQRQVTPAHHRARHGLEHGHGAQDRH